MSWMTCIAVGGLFVGHQFKNNFHYESPCLLG